MTITEKDKPKLYALCGLIVFAALVAYFRFGRSGKGAGAAGASSLVPEELVALPELVHATPVLIQPRSVQPYQPVKRDIFVRREADADEQGAERVGSDTQGELSLQAVTTLEDVRVAVINGKVMREGATFGDYTVEKIGKDWVRLKSASGVKELKMW